MSTKITVCTFGIVAAFFLGIFLLNLFGFSQYAFFLPRITAVQNKTFHESQQYTDGKLNALRQYEVQYSNATTKVGRDSIKAMVRDEFASYDQRNFEGHPDLQAFLSKMDGD